MHFSIPLSVYHVKYGKDPVYDALNITAFCKQRVLNPDIGCELFLVQVVAVRRTLPSSNGFPGSCRLQVRCGVLVVGQA